MNTRAQRDTGPVTPPSVADLFYWISRTRGNYRCLVCGYQYHDRRPTPHVRVCLEENASPAQAPLGGHAPAHPLGHTLRSAERIHATLAALRPGVHQPLAFCSCGVACAYRRAKSDPRQ